MNPPVSMSLLLCLFSIMLVPLAAAGISLIHQGLGRSRSAAQAMLATLCVLAISAIFFVLIGSSWAGFAGEASHSLSPEPACAPLGLARRRTRIRARTQLRRHRRSQPQPFAHRLPRNVCRWSRRPHPAQRRHRPLAARACLHRQRAPRRHHLSVIQPLGMGRRMARPALHQLRPARILRRGRCRRGPGGRRPDGALHVAWIAGPRRGKYADDGMATAIPGHNIVLVMCSAACSR